MGFSVYDFNEQQRMLFADKDRKALGLKTNAEYAEKAAKGQEKIEHDLIMAHVNRHQLLCIHASCSRKVHDLPPGWPDFTFPRPNGKTLFIEVKVTGGKLSIDQEKIHARLRALGHHVYLAGSAAEVLAILKENTAI